MKKLLLLALLTSLLAGCDDGMFPFHDEGWHGNGHWAHGHGHGHGEDD